MGSLDCLIIIIIITNQPTGLSSQLRTLTSNSNLKIPKWGFNDNSNIDSFI